MTKKKIQCIELKNEKDTVFKEASDLSKAMRGELFDIRVVAVLRIISAHGNNFIIFLSLNQEEKQNPI